jgi:VanZ family protein
MSSKMRQWLPNAFLALAFLSTTMLVYASLVPLNYVPLSTKETIKRWNEIPWLQLRIVNRADWIANTLVVMPAAFFWAGAFDADRRSRWFLMLVSPFILIFLASVVLGIELVQVWFPPRTVSQNDILAGWCGAIAGVAVWCVFGRASVGALESFLKLESPKDRLKWIAGLMCIFSLLYTFYPFDFVLSRDEFFHKFDVGRLQLQIDVSSILRFESLKGLVVATAKVIPYGIFMGLSFSGRNVFRPLITLSVVAITLELVQIPIYTKFASTMGAIAGIIGGWAGWCIALTQKRWTPWVNTPWLWIVAWVGWSLTLVMAFNLRYDSILGSGESLDERWRTFFLPPLLRYYFGSEYSAFSNLAGKFGMFAILGVLWGLVGWTRMGRCTTSRFLFGLVWALMLGIAIEVMQVYLPPMIADASDIGIYGLGYIFGYVATAMVFGERGEKTTNSTNNTNEDQANGMPGP